MLIDSRPTAATSSPPSSNVELPSPAKDPTASQSTKRPPTAPTLRSTLPDPVAALKTFSASNTAVTSAVARAPFLSSGKNTMPTPSDDGYGSHRSPLYLSPNQNAVSPPVNASDSVDTPGTLQIAVPVESSPLKNGSTNPLSPRESVCGARVGTSGSPTTKFSQDVLSARAQTSSVMTKPSTRLSDQAASQALRTPKMDLEESSAVSAGGHEGMPPKAPAPQAVHAYPVPLHHPQHRRRLGSTAEEHSPNHRSPRVLERSPQSSAFGQAADTTEDEVESILPLPPAILETPPPSTAQPSSAAPDQLQFVTSSGQEASDEDSRNNSFMLQSVNTNDPTSHLPPHVTTVRQGSGRGNSAADSSAHPSATEERSPRNAHAPIMRDCPAPQGANGPVRPFSSGKGSSVLGAQSSSNFPSTGVATSASSMNRPGSARSWGRAPSALPSTQESGPLDDVEVRPHPPDVPPVPLAPAQSAAMASATVPVRSSPTTSPVLPVHSTPASGTFPAPSSTASSLAVTLPPALAPVPSAPIHVAHEHSPPQIFSNNSSIGSLAATGGQFFLNGTMTVNPPQEGDHHDESDDEFDDMDSSPSSADGEEANIPPTIPFGSQHSNSSFRSSRISSHAGNSIIAGERRGLSASETERPFTLDNRYQNNSFQPALCRVADNSQGGHQLVPNISGEMQDVVKSPTTPSFNKVPAGGEMPFSLWVPHAVECKEAKAPSQVHKALIEDEPSRLFGYTHNQLRVALSVWHMVMFAFCIACFLVTHVLSTGPDEWMAKLSSDRDYLNNLTYAFVIDSLLLTCPVTFVAFFWGFYLYRRRQETRQKRNWGMDHYYEMIQQAHDRGNNSHSCHPRQNSLSRSNLPPNRRQSVHYNGIHNNAENYAVSPLQIIHANRLYFQDDGRFECQCCTGRLCTRYFPLCRLINFWITVCRGFYFVMCAAVLITHLTLGFQIILNLLFAQPSLSAWEVTMSSGTTFACMEVEIQRSCSGWKTLCNATHYESQEQAHQLLCPYCPSLQRAISKFTTTCYDEFDSTRNTNIAAYLVMGITNFVFLVGGFVGTLVTLNFEVWK